MFTAKRSPGRRDLESALKEAERRYSTLIGAVDAAFCVVELIFDAARQPIDYRFIELNGNFVIHTGLHAALGKTIRELVPSIEPHWIEIFANVDRTRATVRFGNTVVDLEDRWFEGVAFPTGDPLLHHVAVFFNDVTAKRRGEATLLQLNANLEKSAEENAVIAEALYDEKERTQVTLNSIGDAVICTNTDGRVTYLNVVAERMTGWISADALGRSLEEVFHIIGSETRVVIPNPMTLAAAQSKVVGLPPLCILVRRDASELSVEDSAAPIHDRHGKVAGAVMVFHDVSTYRALTQQLCHQIGHDGLTGLPNRSLLNDRLTQAVAAVGRRKTSLAVLFLDLDRFKHINDSLGHAIGDRLLQSVALRLTECIRASDTVSRQGGDEFVIVLADIATEKDAIVCAEKVLEALRRPFVLDEHELHISVSIGIAICPHDGMDVEALLKNADSARYEAKEQGRNNFQFYRKELNASAMARQSLESALRRAVERDQLELDYQPIVDVESGAISAVEALVRWRHSERGLMLPADFMAIAEESGLIVPIGQWVLRNACRQVKAWQLAGFARLRIAVNVSAVELRSKSFVAGVATVLQAVDLAPEFLELELTETFLLQDSKSTARVLRSLKDLGVHLALDDFGTGYSSLSYVRRFPMDTLKIDRSFVGNLTSNADDASIVRAVINMGKSLHMRVIAEGVETREQLTFLASHGCHEAQGFFFSRPLEAGKAETLLRRGVASGMT